MTTEPNYGEIAEQLAQRGLFDFVPEVDRERFARALRCHQYRLLKGALLPTIPAGVLASGVLCAYQVDCWGGVERHEVLRPGELFGTEFGTFDANVALRAERKAEVIAFDPGALIACSDSLRSYALRFMRLLSKRQAVRLSESVSKARLRSLDLTTAIKHYISRLAASQGKSPVDVRGRTESAEYLGANRAAHCKALSVLGQAGLVSYKGRQFNLHSVKESFFEGAAGLASLIDTAEDKFSLGTVSKRALKLLMRGKSSAEIGKALGLEPWDVRKHFNLIRRFYCCKTLKDVLAVVRAEDCEE